MKNLHVLPTDKPSKLYKVNDKLYFEEFPVRTVNAGNQYLYITSDDEEVKDCYALTNSFKSKIIKVDKSNEEQWHHFYNCKKIILTTDQELIADGVQAIDDEFLNWFVENPSCESVEVEFSHKDKYGFLQNKATYKIIIPTEEPTISEEAKQRAANYMSLKGALDSHYVDFSNPNADKITSGTTNKPLGNKQTAVDWLIEKLTPSISLQQKHIDEYKKQAKEMEQSQFDKMTETFIKNREQTRPLVFENGFFEGFEYALKSAEDYYEKLAKTKFADDDFTKDYLQEKSNEIYNEKFKKYGN